MPPSPAVIAPAQSVMAPSAMTPLRTANAAMVKMTTKANSPTGIEGRTRVTTLAR
jgi:hypothetical protein